MLNMCICIKFEQNLTTNSTCTIFTERGDLIFCPNIFERGICCEIVNNSIKRFAVECNGKESKALWSESESLERVDAREEKSE